MAPRATVALFRSCFVARLDDGRCLAQPDLLAMAGTLFHAGVAARDVRYEWKAGQRMITAGQQVALLAEMHRRESEFEPVRLSAGAS